MRCTVTTYLFPSSRSSSTEPCPTRIRGGLFHRKLLSGHNSFPHSVRRDVPSPQSPSPTRYTFPGLDPRAPGCPTSSHSPHLPPLNLAPQSPQRPGTIVRKTHCTPRSSSKIYPLLDWKQSYCGEPDLPTCTTQVP